MNRLASSHQRRLAVTPSTRGFGFAVLEGGKLVDWGVKAVTGDKNPRSLTKVEELLTFYQPTCLVLEDPNSSRHAPRIRKLHTQLVRLAGKHPVKVLTRAQVRRAFFAEGHGTNHELAVQLAARFPEELGSRLPPKRRPWQSEDSRMSIFAAVALAVAVTTQKSHEI